MMIYKEKIRLLWLHCQLKKKKKPQQWSYCRSSVTHMGKHCRAVALNGNMKSEEEGNNSRLAASNNVA